MAGYFAFPPHSHIPNQDHEPQSREEKVLPTELIEESLKAEDDPQILEADLRVLPGELDWVRIGGWLRDPYGRKDKGRTEQVRQEVRVRDAERKIVERWDRYCSCWRVLLASSAPIAFRDVPWPVSTPPTSVDDLTAHAIREFIEAPLRVRGNTISKKERIRHLLLRWHPDKLSMVVLRTTKTDRGVVTAGINATFYVLKCMQDSERCPDLSE